MNQMESVYFWIDGKTLELVGPFGEDDFKSLHDQLAAIVAGWA